MDDLLELRKERDRQNKIRVERLVSRENALVLICQYMRKNRLTIYSFEFGDNVFHLRMCDDEMLHPTANPQVSIATSIVISLSSTFDETQKLGVFHIRKEKLEVGKYDFLTTPAAHALDYLADLYKTKLNEQEICEIKDQLLWLKKANAPFPIEKDT